MSVPETPTIASKFELSHMSDRIDGGVIEAVREVELPPVVMEIADGYEQIAGERDRFLWQWIYSLFPAFEVPSVANHLVDSARTQKTLLTVFVTVADDLVENQGDRATFEAVRRIPFEQGATNAGRDDVDVETIEYLGDLWSQIDDLMREAPRYDEFADLFEYDLRQTMNAIDYGRLVNENPRISNLKGNDHYAPHNMCMFPYANIDLMHSPSFSRDDLGVLRETLWDLQRMARVGNDLTTWEREIDEADFSAGIVAYALRNALVTIEDIEEPAAKTEEIIGLIRDACVEEQFINIWWDRYESIKERSPTADSFDLPAIIEGMETVMRYHIASRGLK